MRIRAQLVLMACTILIPVVLAAGIALDKIREVERQAALRGLRETVRATTLIVDREVQGSLSALKSLGNSRNLELRDFRAFYAQAEAIDQKPDVWTVLLDSKGQQILNTVVPFGTPPLEHGRDEAALYIRKPVVTDLLLEPVSGKLLTTIYAPAHAAGGLSFVVAQAFSVDHWKRTALRRDLPDDWIVAVIDKQGKFISRSHLTTELLGKPARSELVAAAAEANDGLIRHDTLEGIEAYDAFSHSSLTGWTIAVAAPVRSVEAAADRAMYVALSGMLVALVMAALAVALFGRNFIRALEVAGKAAVALGHGRRPKVVRTAVAEVNELNDALEHAGDLLDLERGSRREAEAERERLLRNERLARESAQAQNIAKDQFLAMLGHELRNPLAAIAGATALINASGVPAERYVEIIRRQSRHLGRIVDDLLDVSRLLAGKIELERVPVNLADCVNQCVEAARMSELAAGQTIVVQATPVWVYADVVRIDQVLNNLINNAIKFSPPGGSIQVEVAREYGRAVITVSDTGGGIPPDILPHIFEPFFQGPAPATQPQSGLGVGLALVKQLVELHGGAVHAESAGPGRGSVFSFWLSAIAAPEGSVRKQDLPRSSSHKLVYVEDNADARATMAELLRMLDYEVVEVADGESTLPAVLAAQPDAVLMDIGLPDINGYEVARRLRANPATRGIPLIALTGYGQLKDKEEAALAGFTAHLVKPADPDQIIQTIEGVLRLGTPS